MGGAGGSFSGVRLLADMHEASTLREEITDLRSRLTHAEHAQQIADNRIEAIRRYLATVDLPVRARWELDALLAGDNAADVAA